MTCAGLFTTAFHNLLTNKLRSFLTVLGVIIGVAAVISTIAVSKGTQIAVTNAIEKFGTNLLFVSPEELSEQERRQFSGRSKGLTYEDGLYLKEKIPVLNDFAPIIHVFTTIRYEERDQNIQVEATTPSYSEIRNFRAGRGRFLTEQDLTQWRKVAVLGQDIAKKFFGNGDPVNKEIKIGPERFTVVGIMEKKGVFFGTNYDEKVFIPVTTAIRRFKGNSEINYMILQTKVRSDFVKAMEEAKVILTKRHDRVADFRIRAQEEFRRIREQTVATFMWMIRVIAIISLVVGGIGIMNIMLVTVTERTREIGLRKAVGAQRGDILRQFLIEAVTISVMGGVIGIVVGIFSSGFVAGLMAKSMPQNVENLRAVITASSIGIAFSFSVAVGVFFGLYPAYRAARLDPAEALRLEI